MVNQRAFRLPLAITLIAVVVLLVHLVVITWPPPGLQTYDCPVPNSSGQLPPGAGPLCEP
jgi:hypothetical protein